MASIKLIDNPIDTCESLFNVCNYIKRPSKTENGKYVGVRGLSVEYAYEEIIEMQTLFGKTCGRKGYHLIVSFSADAPLAAYDIMHIAKEVSDLFFPEYQVLYGVNMVKEHPHIHFLINSVSLIDGKKLHIGAHQLKYLREQVNITENEYIL